MACNWNVAVCHWHNNGFPCRVILLVTPRLWYIAWATEGQEQNPEQHHSWVALFGYELIENHGLSTSHAEVPTVRLKHMALNSVVATQTGTMSINKTASSDLWDMDVRNMLIGGELHRWLTASLPPPSPVFSYYCSRRRYITLHTPSPRNGLYK